MMRARKQLSFLFVVLALFLQACENESLETLFPEPTTSTHTIDLHWYQNDTESKAEFETGLQWCFSFLGAQLEKGMWTAGTQWVDEEKLSVHLDQLGFNNHALLQFEQLIAQYKQSEEYEKTGGIDAGRFVVSIINNSNHYYKIVDMPETLNEFQAKYRFQQKRAAILESAVAFKERLIHLPEQAQDISSLGYWSQELLGSLKDSSHQVEENEVMDVMPNGQLRFGIYNKNGALIGGGDPKLSVAGKPVKCLWCHEVNIQRAFTAITAIPGYYSPQQFDSIVAENRTQLDYHRASLNPIIDFTDKDQHPEFEKIYIRFMEPSAKRLAKEWGLSVAQVESNLQGIATHRHDEFPEMGDLYFRKDIASFAPYQVLQDVKEARETETDEPNFLL